MTEPNFLPVILGTDINAYTMSRSFYEEYNVRPILVGHMPLAYTAGSTIIKQIHYLENTADHETFIEYLHQLAVKYKKEFDELLLIGTNDEYVTFIIKNREQLKKDYSFNYIDEKLLNQLILKKNFYALCHDYGIDIPLTFFHSCADDTPFEEEVPFPLVIKPSNGLEYYAHPFEGMQKVYMAKNKNELDEIIAKIRKSGYRSDLIIQDFIPGDDTFMWDAVFYADHTGDPQLISFAQVVLQEPTKTGVGNYTALIVRHNKEIMDKLVHFMKEIGYTGFANFDLKYDERDGKFKVFEVNVRQGRSSFYVEQCGHPLSRFFVEDLVEHKKKALVHLKCRQLFAVVPKHVLKTFVKDPEIAVEVKQLIKERKYNNPLFYKKDKGWKRKGLMMLRQLNYNRKYKRDGWTD